MKSVFSNLFFRFYMKFKELSLIVYFELKQIGQIIGAWRCSMPQDFGPTCFIGMESVDKQYFLSPTLNICLKSTTYK